MLTRTQLAQLIDAAALKPTTTPTDVRALCKIARHEKLYSVALPPVWIGLARKTLKGSKVKTVAVIGFPLGYSPTHVKVSEAEYALRRGAAELDMVMPIGHFKARDFAYVRRDMAAVVRTAKGKPVKVIIETGYLNKNEIIRACKLAVKAGAAFVKNSTGLGPRGATVADIALMREAVGPKIGVKAAGGIRTTATALALVRAGANRIGTSSPLAVLAELRKS